jgi:hypothetical protein
MNLLVILGCIITVSYNYMNMNNVPSNKLNIISKFDKINNYRYNPANELDLKITNIIADISSKIDELNRIGKK